jgi:hypothetical protein
MQREGALDYFDGAVNAGTETTRVGKQQIHQLFSDICMKLSRNISDAPQEMAESAILNAGK